MEVHTSLFHLNVPPDLLVQERQRIENEIVKLLAGHGYKEQNTDLSHLSSDVVILAHLLKSDGSSCCLRGYKCGLVTLDIHEYVNQGQAGHFTNMGQNKLKNNVAEILHSKTSKVLPVIKRGSKIERYLPTSDNLLVEYDFYACLLNVNSPYQNVKIMSSHQYGNVLVLDNDVNLAESDLPYTHAITGYGNEDYKDKTVLILGGGDGGILHELLKENVQFITMIDIDNIVIEGARQHLRGICHDSLDQLTGENYQVIVEDCIPYLKQYSEEGRTFDFVINDLTAIPVTTKPIGDQWDFLRMILDYSMQVLAPSGRYYTQGNGVNSREALQMYEEQLNRLSVPVDFSKETVCVPSYHEQWVFYKIWKK